MLDPVKKYTQLFLSRAMRWLGPAPHAWVALLLLPTAHFLSPNTPSEPLKASSLYCVMPQIRRVGPTGLQVGEKNLYA